MDVLCLLPLDFFYFKVGVNPLLRFPRCLKVSQSSQSQAEQQLPWTWRSPVLAGVSYGLSGSLMMTGGLENEGKFCPKGFAGLLVKHFISILKYSRSTRRVFMDGETSLCGSPCCRGAAEGFCGEVILSAENLEHAALLLLPVYGIL